jgi:hypothetical protein
MNFVVMSSAFGSLRSLVTQGVNPAFELALE